MDFRTKLIQNMISYNLLLSQFYLTNNNKKKLWHLISVFIWIGNSPLSTGIFTAPLDGFYEFSFVSYRKENINSQITVEKNGHVEFSSHRKRIIHNDTDGFIWIMNLKMGDRIRLKINNFYDGSFKIFNGKLIVRL